MSTALTIRPERPADCARIRHITELAFKGRPYADGDEQDVIDRLRAVGKLDVSLVAEVDGEVIGHIAFSEAVCSDGSSPWFALGPVSVLPEQQNRGVGAALIRQGIEQIEARGALGCILTGNPDYYRRFGFELAPQHVPENEPAEFFMLKKLNAATQRTPISGRFRFHAAFYGEPGA